MTALALQVPFEHDEPPLDHDRIVFLHQVGWVGFEGLLALRGDEAGPRISYLDGELELMTPSRGHERTKSLIGRLVEIFCMEREIPFTPLGGWTLKEQSRDCGAEPDECYVFSDDDDPDRRPQLAIEVVWTSGRLNKLEIYRRLGIEEVWLWRRGHLQPYVLEGDTYHPREQSRVLPGLDLSRLCAFLDRPTAYAAMRDYRDALRAGP